MTGFTGTSPHIRPSRWRYRAGIASAALAGLALLAVALGAPRALPLTLTLASAAVLAGSAVLDWRFGLGAFTAWLMVGDLLRKFTGNSLSVLGATECIAAAAMLRFGWELWHGRTARWSTSITLPLGVFCAWAVLRAAGMALEHPRVALTGILGWCMFTPLLYTGHALGRDARAAARWGVTAVTLGAVAAAGSLLQLWGGLGLLNPTEGGGLPLQVIHTYLDAPLVPRPNSVFMHAGRLSGVLLATVWTIPLALGPRPVSGTRRAALSGAGLLIVTALVLSGQRATLAMLVTGALGIGLACLVGRAGGGATRRRTVLLMAAMLTLAAGLVTLGGAASGSRLAAYYGDTFSPARLGDTLTQLEYSVLGVRDALAGSWWGHGTGAASVGRPYALNVPWHDPHVMPLEGGTGVLAWEWGLAGPMLWLWLAGTIASQLWRRGRAATQLIVVWQCAAGVAAVLTSMVVWFHLTVSAYQSYPLQALFWLTIGAVLAPSETEA